MQQITFHHLPLSLFLKTNRKRDMGTSDKIPKLTLNSGHAMTVVGIGSTEFPVIPERWNWRVWMRLHLGTTTSHGLPVPDGAAARGGHRGGYKARPVWITGRSVHHIQALVHRELPRARSSFHSSQPQVSGLIDQRCCWSQVLCAELISYIFSFLGSVQNRGWIIYQCYCWTWLIKSLYLTCCRYIFWLLLFNPLLLDWNHMVKINNDPGFFKREDSGTCSQFKLLL